jgi:RNA polymerase sigma factor (sigma-70 family)
MSATETLIEGKREARTGFFGERAEELDNVVSRYLPLFYRIAFRFLGNAQDAEDAVQDALLCAYQHLGQFRGQAKLSTWLTTIVINAARQLRRRRGRYLSLEEQQGKKVSHYRNGYPIRSQVRKKSAPHPKPMTVWSMESSSSHQRCEEHFSCAISTA